MDDSIYRNYFIIDFFYPYHFWISSIGLVGNMPDCEIVVSKFNLNTLLRSHLDEYPSET